MDVSNQTITEVGYKVEVKLSTTHEEGGHLVVI